ncbi:MAG: hypothetical protein ACRDN0_39120, partial [Trebonia sp.]
MDEKKPFALELYQHPWRPGTAEVQAVIRVSARPGDGRAGNLIAAGAAEVIILDCSGSMGHPVSKLNAAKRAAHAALGVMRDGTEFAVLKGTDDVAAVYP